MKRNAVNNYVWTMGKKKRVVQGTPEPVALVTFTRTVVAACWALTSLIDGVQERREISACGQVYQNRSY